MGDRERVAKMAEQMAHLSDGQLNHLERLVATMGAPADVQVNPDSDFMTERLAALLGEVLQVHHLNSLEPFTKDKFEYALVTALVADGRAAEKMPRGNPGQDVVVNGSPWSLKTQADRSIRGDEIHISKFMELGRGAWEDEKDLEGLRQRMFNHMQSYERIFTLRCLTPGGSQGEMIYEMVEIPKKLLEKSVGFPCVMKNTSRQTPKPGVCDVFDDKGRLLFELYFDGGTERKLQVRKLSKAECKVHATWTFALNA